MRGLNLNAQIFYAVLSGVLLTCAGWVLLPLAETKFFPVSSSAEITKVERKTESSLWVWGSAIKLRDCTFEGIRWYRGVRTDRAVIIRVTFLEKNKIREAGAFDFGPWEIVVNDGFSLDDTYADALHSCKIFGVPLPWITRSRFHN